MERRLQERCAELQREVFRLQGAHNTDGYKSLEKHPVALPRQVLPRTNNKQTGSSEHEDEGISSSETGQSLSPEPILILPQNAAKKYALISNSNNEYNGNNNSSSQNHNHNNNNNNNTIGAKDDDVNTTIEEVIEELENIVHDAEQDMQQDLKNDRSKLSADNLAISSYHVKSLHLHSSHSTNSSNSHSNNIIGTCMNAKNRTDQFYSEKEIVPVNLLPQPPKKSRSLSHLLGGGSDFDESDYGVHLANNETRISYYDDIDMEIEHSRHGYRNEPDVGVGNGTNGGGGGGVVGNNGVGGGEPNPDLINQTSTNRELLNVIMDARDKDENIFMTAPGHYGQMVKSHGDGQSLMPKTAPQKFNGVFFMTEMSTPAKYPKVGKLNSGFVFMR